MSLRLPEPEGECIVQVGMRFFHHRDGRPGSIGWFDLEGQTWETWDRLCQLSNDLFIYQLAEPAVAPPLPPEPPVGSVVLSKLGLAWQRAPEPSKKWWCAADRADQTWAELNAHHGPLTLLVPDPEALR